MIPLHYFPAINASLNLTTGILLLVGHSFLKTRRITAHKRTMIAACITAAVFLSCYLYYHYFARVTHFKGTGIWRPIYFTILISHTTLAIIIVPMILVTLTRGLKGRFPQHRKIARITYPLWLYVSATGVLVYLFLYQWFPSR